MRAKLLQSRAMNQSPIDLLLRRCSVLVKDLIPSSPSPTDLKIILRFGLRELDCSQAEPWRI